MHWKDLKVWEKTHNLVLEVYRVTSGFPKEELYALTNQLRRSSASVAANIVEGQSRNTTKEYLQFLYNSRGSLEEARYHLLLAKDLEYLAIDKYMHLENQYEEISKMLNSLISRIKGLTDKGLGKEGLGKEGLGKEGLRSTGLEVQRVEGVKSV